MASPPPYTPTNPDRRELPPGWIEQYDKNYKAWFYVNTREITKITKRRWHIKTDSTMVPMTTTLVVAIGKTLCDCYNTGNVCVIPAFSFLSSCMYYSLVYRC
ncbi:hypothetical protein C8Q75DRAFT_276476 [Abortiporus biennis]|nr:hypothetical protein C8Q75DRAFT_276476 [Abortiporus biennis]